jgi:polyhydroxyalkanoate synthesis repressor PhaR
MTISPQARPMSNAENPITIKKYANRRLYNTASSAYVTLADLAKMVKSGEDFVVYDAKTNEEITRSVLTQIIFEQEGVEGQSLLPIAFLRQVIRFYGDSVQSLLPSYLEYSIERFSGEQHKMRDTMSRALDPSASFAALQEMTRQNLAAFNKALGMFSPFVAGQNAAAPPAKEAATEIGELRDQLSEMKRRLDEIVEKK